MRGWTLVILFAPDKVPCRCDNEECEKDHRCVIHVLWNHWDRGRHTEEW